MSAAATAHRLRSSRRRFARRATRAAVTLALLVAAGVALACRQADPGRGAPDNVLPGVGDPRGWVTMLAPDLTSPGYTLDLYRRRVPIVVDLAGRIVHAWPQARVESRVRLLSDGSLLAIALGRGLVRYDWEGREVWRYHAGRDLPHHDVIALRNGNVLAIVRRDGEETDDLLEVDAGGREVWRWRSGEPLGRWARERGISQDDGDLLAEGEEAAGDDLTDQELAEQRRHLRALGYVD
ncbi:MAG TPA: aryl-sulfate sulfotransferase [Thermoanaerobaculia bacterium]|nr:aryl-sulfate sulfotransferase [Thermoanaerobaculia bacterium]